MVTFDMVIGGLEKERFRRERMIGMVSVKDNNRQKVVVRGLFTNR